jgi:hypothetical protein
MSKKLDKLLFSQSGKCFFCDKLLERSVASIEHLQALSNGGKSIDENMVACCRDVNQYLGNLPLKEKMRVVIRYGGQIPCPMNRKQSDTKQITLAAKGKSKPIDLATTQNIPILTSTAELVEKFLKKLQQQSKNRPKKLKTLINSIATYYQWSHEETEALVKVLVNKGSIHIVDGNKVKYDK